MLQKIAGCLSLIALGVLAAKSEGATPIYDSGGFEAPRFTTAFVNPNDPTLNPGGTPLVPFTGNLRAQDAAVAAWRESTTDPNGGEGTATGTATVETPTAPTGGSGLQDVKVTRTQFDDRWAPIVNYTQNLTNPVVNIDWSMNVSATAGQANTFGPFFGIEANDDQTPNIKGSILRIGGFGVDATSGELLYETGGVFSTIVDPANPSNNLTVDFGKYNNFEISLDFATQKYTVSLNGAPVFTDIDFLSAGITGLTDADISALAEDVNPSGTAFFDNYVITAVPEPAATALLTVGLAAMMRRRRICEVA